MPTYKIIGRVTHGFSIHVEADSEEEALNAAEKSSKTGVCGGEIKNSGVISVKLCDIKEDKNVKA